MCGNIFPAYQRNESNTKWVKIKSILGHESSLGKNKMYKRERNMKCTETFIIVILEDNIKHSVILLSRDQIKGLKRKVNSIHKRGKDD